MTFYPPSVMSWEAKEPEKREMSHKKMSKRWHLDQCMSEMPYKTRIVFSQQWHQFVSVFSIVLLDPSELTGHCTTQSSPVNHILKIKFNCHQVIGILDYFICWPPCYFNPLHHFCVLCDTSISDKLQCEMYWTSGTGLLREFGSNCNKYTKK